MRECVVQFARHAIAFVTDGELFCRRGEREFAIRVLQLRALFALPFHQPCNAETGESDNQEPRENETDERRVERPLGFTNGMLRMESSKVNPIVTSITSRMRYCHATKKETP